MANSRLRLSPLGTEEHPDREVFAGWDEPFRTYFAQVFDGVDASGQDILSLELGTDFFEITDPAALIDALRPYAEIPDEFAAILTASPAADTAIIADLRPDAVRRGVEDLVDSLSSPSTLDAEGSDELRSTATGQPTTVDSGVAEDDAFGEDGGLHSGMGM